MEGLFCISGDGGHTNNNNSSKHTPEKKPRYNKNSYNRQKNRVSRFACAFSSCSPRDRYRIDNLSWHTFPKEDGKIRRKWIESIRKARQDTDWEPSSKARVCSRHFPLSCYQRKPLQKKQATRLIASAVPKEFIPEEELYNEQMLAEFSVNSSNVEVDVEYVEESVINVNDLINQSYH